MYLPGFRKLVSERGVALPLLRYSYPVIRVTPFAPDSYTHTRYIVKLTYHTNIKIIGIDLVLPLQNFPVARCLSSLYQFVGNRSVSKHTFCIFLMISHL